MQIYRQADARPNRSPNTIFNLLVQRIKKEQETKKHRSKNVALLGVDHSAFRHNNYQTTRVFVGSRKNYIKNL